MWQGKRKAITFSYDDGVLQDKRLVEIFNSYGLKATFNINSGLMRRTDAVTGEILNPNKLSKSEIADLYAGHEVAVHTISHPSLAALLADEEIIAQTEQDRINLSEYCGYPVFGMAYPNGSYDERVMRLLEQNTQVKYARTTKSTCGFELPANYYSWHPTCHHKNEKLFELAEQFFAEKGDRQQLFYIWGHSYEFDNDNNWERFIEFCAAVSGKADIFYGTNAQVLCLK